MREGEGVREGVGVSEGKGVRERESEGVRVCVAYSSSWVRHNGRGQPAHQHSR